MSEENSNNARYRDLFNLLGQLAAFLTIIVYILLIVNANWPFIPEGELLDLLNVLKIYAPLIVVLISGLEFAQDKSFLIKLIIYIAVVAIVIFQFFPGTWENFIGVIK